MNRLRVEGLDGPDGRTLVDEVNDALDQICEDLVNRPELSKARKVELVVTLAPDSPKRGGSKEPIVDVQLKVKVPAKLLTALKGVVEDGQLLFDLGPGEAADAA